MVLNVHKMSQKSCLSRLFRDIYSDSSYFHNRMIKSAHFIRHRAARKQTRLIKYAFELSLQGYQKQWDTQSGHYFASFILSDGFEARITPRFNRGLSSQSKVSLGHAWLSANQKNQHKHLGVENIQRATPLAGTGCLETKQSRAAIAAGFPFGSYLGPGIARK